MGASLSDRPRPDFGSLACALALKAQGQADSTATLSDDTRDTFHTIISQAAVGAVVTVNTFRDDLDAADIPHSARGGLMHSAISAGLIEPLTVHVEGVGPVAVSVPSSGVSAHRQTVRAYRRTGVGA